MLYLEDYLEMIEHLPQELRDRFTEMREMDLQVQNAMDSLDARVKQFFAAAKKMKQPERDVEYQKIDQDYYKALEDADEKVHIANQIYELLERYIRKLDQELQKFKMELEADNAGITQILEQRSYELDKLPSVSSSLPLNNIKSEKRKHTQLSNSIPYNPPEKLPVADKLIPPSANDIMRDTLPINRAQITGHSPSSSSTSSSCSMNSLSSERSNVLTQSKGHPFGGGGNALAAAASQAIAATQQSLKRSSNQSQSSIVQQGRRTASLKASYEAINAGFPSLGKEFTFSSRDMATLQSAAAAAAAANAQSSSSSSGVVVTEPKMKTKKASRTNVLVQQAEPTPVFDDSEDSSAVDESGLPVDWSCDPNEPRYCICNQVSYGDMVACDNADCPFEWFHYPCVGITQPPKGKWFCPQCTISMKRRRKEK